MEFKQGSPDLDDATSEIEQDANWAINEAMKMVTREGPNLLNRPLFTNKVPIEDQRNDWMAAQMAPDLGEEWFGKMWDAQVDGWRTATGATPEAEVPLQVQHNIYEELMKMDSEMRNGN